MGEFERAIEELQQGNYSEGMVILQNLLEDNPDSTDILYSLGMCYSEMGMIRKSIAKLERCVSIDPGFANALVALGFSYYQDGADEKALDALLKALEIEPDNVYALKNIGALYCKKDEPDKAIEVLERAQSLMPEMPEVNLGLAQAYELKGRVSDATELYKKVKDSGAPDYIADKAIEGLNRMALEERKEGDREQQADTVMYCLAAIEQFSKIGNERVKEIAYEVAMLGTTGLSVNDPEKKYTLKSLEGKFSGMQLVCYMFVGFKIVDDKLPPVADLESEYQQALKLYRSRLDEN